MARLSETISPLILAIGLFASWSAQTPAHSGGLLRLGNASFAIEFDPESGGVMALRRPGDQFDTNYVLGREDHPKFAIDDSRWLGDLLTRYRTAGGEWTFATTSASDDVRRVQRSETEVLVTYDAASKRPQGLGDLRLNEAYRLEGDALVWRFELKNASANALEIGDLGVPLLFNSYYVADPVTTYTKRVVRHHLIAGNHSFMVWMRPNGSGPFLVMTPLPGTRLEYFDRAARASRAPADAKVFGERSGFEGLFTAYIHAGVQAAEIENRGTWRLPVTTARLQPSGRDGDRRTYGFRFEWAKDYEDVRALLFKNGLLEIQVVPGMVIPTDLAARVAIRSRQPITAIRAEHAGTTQIRKISDLKDRAIYELKLTKLGENLITIDYGPGLHTYLEFFVTEPLETLINKRARFIAKQQQVRKSGRWYEGLFSQWSMKERKLRNPDEPGELHPYMVGGADDPGLCKAPFIATKNVHIPDRDEIEKVEYYLEHFVWGKLQRNDHEDPFPFGIYGSDNWYINRFSKIGYNSGGNGQEHMWRTFDYTHMIQLYYNLYRAAKLYPGLTRYLDAKGYLDRAFGTAMAFYNVPYNIRMGDPWSFRGWCDWAYKQGNFHELYIPHVIDALEHEGRTAEARRLRTEWEKKVKYMVYDHPYPFGSEMFFDTTAFESTHAVAKYGLEHELRPDENLWQDKNSGKWYSHPVVKRSHFADFMERSIAGNIAARGWLETSYWQLGSDIRQHGNSSYALSYMTQMGGWAILDYALRYAKEPEKYMRLGYASYLGSWALMNTGTAESNYGYWYPGEANDGAASWAFGPEKYFKPWAGPEQGRGGWVYDGEIDNGFSGALRTAATVVVSDSIFGEFAYGGDLRRDKDGWQIVMRDGLRQRLHLMNLRQPLRLTLSSDAFSQAAPIRVGSRGDSISFTLEPRWSEPHTAELNVSGLRTGTYVLRVGGRATGNVRQAGTGNLTFHIPVGSGRTERVEIQRQQQ